MIKAEKQITKKLRILIVEPDLILAKTYKKKLEQESINVKCVTSAQSAIEAIDARSPDLIILEIQLRTHNGIELLNEIQSYDDLKNIPIIIHTFISEQLMFKDPSGHFSRFNIKHYLYKPKTSLDYLLESVMDVLA